nr:hypothetical protein [Tanacetum cinerariifolium]
MLDEKLVLVDDDDDGKPLKKVDDPINADSNSEMERCSMKLQDTYNEDMYDDDDELDDYGLVDAQMMFAFL